MFKNVFDGENTGGFRNRSIAVATLLTLITFLAAACLEVTQPGATVFPPAKTEMLRDASPQEATPPTQGPATPLGAATPVLESTTPTPFIPPSPECSTDLSTARPCSFPLQGQIVFLAAREDNNSDGIVDQNDRLGYYAIRMDGTEQCWIPGLQDVQEAAVHPCGRRIAFLEDVAEKPALAILDGESGEIQVLASGLEEHLQNLLWSPDGQWIAFNSYEYLHVVYAGVGPDRFHYRVPATSAVFGTSSFRQWDWSPDSQQLAFVGVSENQTAIYRIRRDGSAPTLVTEITADSSQGLPELGVLRWPPDGSQIFITLTFYDTQWDWGDTDPQLTSFSLYAIDLATGSRTLLPAPAENEICGPDWSPDGQTVVYYTPCSAYDLMTELVLMERDGSNHRRLFQSLYGFSSSGKWSPDGKWIVFQTLWETCARIFLIQPDRTNLHQLTNGCCPVFSPMWLPE